jgi:N-acetylglucosaminyldiphosphoundecaprenol N-acetyl-beta-D-mannosaminyltransferase
MKYNLSNLNFHMFIKFFDYKISENLPTIDLNKKITVNTINAHAFICAESDNRFKKSLLKSDIVTPDGVGVTLALFFIKKLKINKVAGWDIHKFYLNQAEAKKLKVFYMGAGDSTLIKIKEKIGMKFPNVEVDTYSPPFKPVLSKKDNEKIIKKINDFAPHILFVGMTAPKQEKWVYENIDFISCNVACSIGAVFDFFAETQKRASKIWIKLHLEWLERFLRNPKKMYDRVFISIPKFLFFLIKNRKII